MGQHSVSHSPFHVARRFSFDFSLEPAALREQVTVTASGREQSTLSAFQGVNVVDSIELTQRPPVSLGEALEGTPGVAKRSFGPGNSRPVIRALTAIVS